jgi:hypothetical protein
MEKISTSNLKLVNFPYSGQYAESFISLNKNQIYFPLNGPKAGWYLYDQGKFKIVNLFTDSEIVLGSKLVSTNSEMKSNKLINTNNSEIKSNKLVGAVSNKGTITIYDLDKKTTESIYVGGYPNDLCVDDEDPNIIYVVTNIDFTIYCCKIYRVNLITKDVTSVFLDQKFIIGTGINIKDKQIYLSTLTNIYKIDKNTSSVTVISNKSLTYPFYDNVSIDSDNSNLNIAIYDYDQKLVTKTIEHPYLYGIFMYLISSTTGIGYLDVTHNNIKPNNKQIRFLRYNITNNTGKFLQLDKTLTNFDNYVTQLNRIDENTFCFVNWKANSFLLVDLPI